MFKFFEQKVGRALRGTGYFVGLSAATGASVFLETKRWNALQEANPDCDIVSEWKSFGGVCGYNKLSLRPKREAGQKEPAQPSRRP